jgi:N-acetylglutamate synthase-like GNAT family acetyltransferase
MNVATLVRLGELGRPGSPGHLFDQDDPRNSGHAGGADRLFDVRTATPGDADGVHALINQHVDEGQLLPRRREEIAVHASRFVVVVDDGGVIGCADLAPLSGTVAEVRSLVVSEGARSLGLGRRLVNELVRRATLAEFEKLCAFTHSPSYFVQMGFSIVPQVWVPEKIETDCHGCAHFRRCSKYAVILTLSRTPHAHVPLPSLHG